VSNNKNDLTRIEDLGEFIHELNSEDEVPEIDPLESEVPELPSSTEEDISFDSGEENSSFESSEDFGSSFESDTEENSFSSEFSSDSESQDNFTTPIEETTHEALSTEWESTPEEVHEETTQTEVTPIKEDYSSSFMDETSFETSQPEPVIELRSDYKTPETFEDLKKFSESSSLSGMATEGNPSFSVLVKNVRFIEDVSDIVTLLKEFNLLPDSEEQTKARLMRGMLLIPRISEYAAIYLTHKLRRFDIDIQLGLSDEIHPPKHLETPETGIVSKHNLYQNQTHHFQFDDSRVDLNQIIVSATSSLDGFQILKYLGVASEHKIMEGQIVEDENSKEVTTFYHELAQKLKAHALKANANAVVGLNYQLTPLPTEYGLGTTKYRLSCTGNLVWISKL
jgi:uncharacterized protein YbjQ (UPF0145 family)